MIEALPTQMAFLGCRDRFRAYVGGIGAGKTYAGALAALQCAGEGGVGSLGMIVAPTERMLKDSTLRTLQEIAGSAMKINWGEMIATLSNRAEILLRSADNPERLRGPNLDWAWMDEAALCDEMTWRILIGRLRGHGRAGPCWLTCTPKGRNWLYDVRDQLTIFTARTHDNTYLAGEYVKSLESAYKGKFAQQELLGQFVSYEGLVYDGFDKQVHVMDRPDVEMQAWRMGVDEGYTAPAVCVLVGVDGDGRIHIAEEWYERQQLQDAHVTAARAMNARHKCEGVFVDKSAPGLSAALRKAGLPVRHHGAKVLAGIRQVQNYLAVAEDGRPRLTVSPRCVNTIAEFLSYSWKQRGEEHEAVDEPDKINDHALDAARYSVATLSRKPFKAMTVGRPYFDGGR